MPRVKTFMEFITESLVTAFKTSEGYCEVFQNPSLKELVSAADASVGRDDLAFNYSSSAAGPFNTGMVTVAGAMTDDKLFVWNRDIAMHLPAIREIAKDLNISRTSMVPVYLDFKRTSNQVAVRYAAYSGNSLYHKLTDKKVVAMAKKHPAFKQFQLVAGF